MRRRARFLLLSWGMIFAPGSQNRSNAVNRTNFAFHGASGVGQGFQQYPTLLTRFEPFSPDRASSLHARHPGPSSFWKSLCAGTLIVKETSSNEEACEAVAQEREPELRSPFVLNEQELILLHRVLQGEPQKNLALDFDRSPAGISQLLGVAYAKMGFEGRVVMAPLAIVLCALQHFNALSVPGVRLQRFDRDRRSHVSLTLPALDRNVLTSLSQCERDVAALVAVGATYRQIANFRDRSARTIANQVAAVFRKLGVRGRFDLIRKWASFQWGSERMATVQR